MFIPQKLRPHDRKFKSLKFFLEDLVNKGHIKEFVKESVEQHKKIEQ